MKILKRAVLWIFLLFVNFRYSLVGEALIKINSKYMKFNVTAELTGALSFLKKVFRDFLRNSCFPYQ